MLTNVSVTVIDILAWWSMIYRYLSHTLWLYDTFAHMVIAMH